MWGSEQTQSSARAERAITRTEAKSRSISVFRRGFCAFGIFELVTHWYHQNRQAESRALRSRFQSAEVRKGKPPGTPYSVTGEGVTASDSMHLSRYADGINNAHGNWFTWTYVMPSFFQELGEGHGHSSTVTRSHSMFSTVPLKNCSCHALAVRPRPASPTSTGQGARVRGYWLRRRGELKQQTNLQ